MTGRKTWNQCHIGYTKAVIKLSQTQAHWLHCSIFFLLLLLLLFYSSNRGVVLIKAASGLGEKTRSHKLVWVMDECLDRHRLYHPAISCSTASWGCWKQFWFSKFENRKKWDNAKRIWQIFCSNKHTLVKVAGSGACWSADMILQGLPQQEKCCKSSYKDV